MPRAPHCLAGREAEGALCADVPLTLGKSVMCHLLLKKCECDCVCVCVCLAREGAAVATGSVCRNNVGCRQDVGNRIA